MACLIRTDAYLSALAKHIVNFELVKKRLFPLLSQIGINYRESSLSKHDGDDGFKVKAGDRMPYFLINGPSVYDYLRAPKFHYLAVSNTPYDLQTMKSELGQEFADLVDFNTILPSPGIAAVFGNENAFHLLLRPDNHIGCIASVNSLDAITNYFESSVLGFQRWKT